MPLLKLKDKIFYGWVIVVTSFVISATLEGIRYSFGVFFKSLEGEFALSRAATSSVLSAYMIFCVVFAVVGGWTLDRYGPKRVVFIMGLLTGVSLLLTSQAISFWQLFLSYSLVLSIGTGAAFPVLMSTVSRWFDKKRGFALGIASSGGALGTIVIVPFAAYLISNFGWRMSYIVIGLLAWFVVISLSMLLRNDPSEIGVLPDGVKLNAGKTEVTGSKENSQLIGFSLLQTFKTRSYWFIWAIWLFFSLCLTLVMTHVVPYATDSGILTMEAATILSVMGGFSIVSKLLTGRISDIIGRKVPGIICALLQAGALVGLIWARELWMFYLFAVVFGVSWGGLGIALTALPADIFGVRNLGSIMGTLEMAFAVGGAIGSAIGGFMFDVTGSYATAFAIGAATMLITALLVALTGREMNTQVN